jgi:hypothetical protein
LKRNCPLLPFLTTNFHHHHLHPRRYPVDLQTETFFEVARWVTQPRDALVVPFGPAVPEPRWP